MATEPILSDFEQQMIKTVIFGEYEKRWGPLRGPERQTVIRTIDIVGTIMAESARLDA